MLEGSEPEDWGHRGRAISSSIKEPPDADGGWPRCKKRVCWDHWHQNKNLLNLVSHLFKSTRTLTAFLYCFWLHFLYCCTFHFLFCSLRGSLDPRLLYLVYVWFLFSFFLSFSFNNEKSVVCFFNLLCSLLYIYFSLLQVHAIWEDQYRFIVFFFFSFFSSSQG